MKIFVSIPCHDGAIHNELVYSLLEIKDTHTCIFRFYPNIAPLDNARNRAVKDFLTTDCTHFLHIDNDIVIRPEYVQKMIDADKDVISPLCLTTRRDDHGYMFPMLVSFKWNKKKNGYTVHYGKGIEKVDIITGGCHLVKRKVFEKLGVAYKFIYNDDGTVKHSEDFYFSQQCTKNGFELYTHYDLICDHYKQVNVKDINDLMVKYGR